ncbi:hypothetical protein LTR56_024359 [Elasticomyces elasticus]|nr:hypothetical protein LTR56_024359 [Elasticomyces elasticus]KAK3623276.1 hypothetical protein LTR22_024448 [Elasticomyces elasticus]KAK4905916.1 hypothetical protein LTR49_024862 [Elasticomyces elasticus]KAK5743359.1 hypothetical protein LTS12_023910 [Elasticomyces elasticus]
MTANKGGRPAAYDTTAIRDELFGFLVAGHECTAEAALVSTSGIKPAYAAGENPTVAEIVKSNLPYLDATLAEILRCGGAIPAIPRRATEDTEIFGHRIPKGTNVFMLTQGPGYLDKPFQVDESRRNKSSWESHDKNGMWDVADIGSLQPERWLILDENGGFVFETLVLGPHNHS